MLPMEEINLHFTGDIHAVESAHNLLAAMLDNHLHQGNDLGIDPREVTWRRAMDMNERALRNIVVGLGGRTNGVPRETGFDITVASEIMAILCLSENLADLKERLSKVIVGYTTKGKVVKAGDLKAQGAMAALLKEAINPNLVQTVKHVPAFVHGGPFANIAHGTNSIVATRMALKLRDYAIVEAGFASDLGAEKFFDIVCRLSGLSPSAVVLVTTVRSLKHHGGVKKEELSKENLDALSSGISNLEAHLDILSNFGLPVVVALNKFNTDTKEELDMVMEAAKKRNARIALSEVWEKGGEGGIDLAKEVLEAIGEGKTYRTLYDLDMSLKEKIKTIATRIYGADDVEYVPQALAMLEDLEQRGFGSLPVCMAKTQLSLSDDPKKLGRPKDYRVTVREVRLSAGAGFVVAICGSIMTMPGLPKKPAAESIDIDEKGNITGLF